MIIDALSASLRKPILLAAFSTAAGAAGLAAQQTASRTLSLSDAIELARRANPDLRAAREAVNTARGRERQARALPNPTFSYGREQTSARGQTNSQNIVSLDQRIEVGGIRSARSEGAVLRRQAAESRRDASESQLEFETARAYALAVAADRRAAIAEESASAFAQALRTSEQRLAAGDVSGYSNRRLRLEAARYAAANAEAALARRSARLALATLISGTTDSILSAEFLLSDTLPLVIALPGFGESTPSVGLDHVTEATMRDSLSRLALRLRADLRANTLEASAARADQLLATRERVPVPAVSLGFKNEHVAGMTAGPGTPEGFTGFAAGFSIPLPVWDRREGTVAAAGAEMRRREAETEALRRRVTREVAEAFDAYAALRTQLSNLGAQLGDETRTAMRAVQVAYTEGEVSLVEWLDAVRAYQEAESSLTSLRAEAAIRRAALERAVGSSLSSSTRSRLGAGAPDKD
jgi:outer membrane protein, heavy metal efflux system